MVAVVRLYGCIGESTKLKFELGQGKFKRWRERRAPQTLEPFSRAFNLRNQPDIIVLIARSYTEMFFYSVFASLSFDIS